MPRRVSALMGGLFVALPIMLWAASGAAQEPQPWQRDSDPRYQRPDEAYRPGYDDPRWNGGNGTYNRDRSSDAYAPPYGAPRAPANDAYSPRYGGASPPADDAYPPPRAAPGYGQPYYPPSGPPRQGYGQPYSSPPGPYGQPYAAPPDQAYNDPAGRSYGPPGYDRPYGYRDDGQGSNSYSSREVLDAGHSFFGSVSKGLASVVEYAFQSQGRPNGYILGQDAGGAVVAGLRYGEGVLYTKDAGTHRVYWQGPSIGWDLGGEGSKVMVLVYNLRDPREIYQRFGGVDGSAYIVGGVGLTFQKSGDVVVAPIRAGVGLRLGANIGYLKYTRTPTWNPF